MSSACQKAAKNLRSFIDDGPSTSKSDMNNNSLELKKINKKSIKDIYIYILMYIPILTWWNWYYI